MKNFKSKLVIISEMLFVFLPIFIVVFYNLITHNYQRAFFSNDWIFGAIILWGQSIVKFTSGLLKTEKRFKWQNVSFIIALLVIFGLVPSAIILVCLLNCVEFSLLLMVLQYLSFILSSIVYYNLGSVSQIYLDE